MCFFFLKQKTAYELRISDWSSDVCSSDLLGLYRGLYKIAVKMQGRIPRPGCTFREYSHATPCTQYLDGSVNHIANSMPLATLNKKRTAALGQQTTNRSEERRVGQECVSPFKSRWSPYH